MKTLKIVIFSIILICQQIITAQGIYSKQDEKTGLYGFVDADDKYVVEPIYKEIDFSFSDKPGLYHVTDKKDKVGFVNEQGKEVVPCIYDGAFYAFSGYSQIEVKKDEYTRHRGLIDSTGKITIPPKYLHFNVSENNLIIVSEELSMPWGVIDATGKTIIPFEYSWMWYMYKGLIPAQKNDTYGVINTKNETIVPFSFEEIHAYNKNDLAVAKKNGKYGFINITGKEIIPFIYDDATDINFGVANAVKKDGKWGVVDNNNKVIIPFEYYSIYSYMQNTVSVSKTEQEEPYEIDLTTKKRVAK